MQTLIKFTLALAVIALASAGVAAQQNSDLIGSYLHRFEWGGSRITLKNNGTFTSESSGCTHVTTSSGPYSVANNVLRFTMKKLTLRSYSDNKERDLTKRKERKKYLDTDEPFKPESWELQIVRWGERVYFMNSESFVSFVRAINLGFEPRSVDGYRAHYGVIYLREGDEKTQVTGPPPLPEEFLRELLPAPVIATVLSIKPEGQFTFATIDRGSADGLKKDMELVTTVSNTLVFQAFRIESVTENSAEVYISGDVKVGDKLTTRVAEVWRFSE